MGRLYTLVIVLVLLFTSSVVSGQSLPRGLSPEERAMIESGNLPDRIPIEGAITSVSAEDAPRSIAEWEELQAIAITWTSYKDILAQIVQHAVKEVEVYIITRNASVTRFELESRGVDPDSNIVYIDSDYNSVWIRDYGPNPAYLGDVDSLVLVDWIYNRPRPKDDVVPAAIAATMNVPLLSTTQEPVDLVNTGGNYMTDGLGRGFSSELVLEENGPGNIWGSSNHGEEEVDAIMAEFMGIEEYVKMETLPYDGIHHIDMHMKLLDETTLLVGEYPEGIADGPQIEANIQYVVENFKVAMGRDYEVVRIPMPPDQFGRYPHQGGYYRTYANSLIINKTILVPTYELQYDTTALRIWEEAKPGYNVVGINCNQIIPASGALHCITKEIGVNAPLWIAHEAPGEIEYQSEVDIAAIVKHRSGMEGVDLGYSTNGAEFITIPMSQVNDDTWVASVTNLNPSDTIKYYFTGTASNGKTISRPMVAPEGTFTLIVGEETTSIPDLASVIESARIFPNPASGLTCLDVELLESDDVYVGVIDASGRTVMTLPTQELQRGNNKLFIDVAGMMPGIYTVQLAGQKGFVNLKLAVR